MTTPPWWKEKVMVYYLKRYTLGSTCVAFVSAGCTPENHSTNSFSLPEA